MLGQIRAPFHWRVKFPHILVSIVHQMPLAQSASQVQKLHCRGHCWGKGRALTQSTKRLLSCRCSSPHPPTSLPCRKLWRLLPPLQCMGMVTTQSSHVQRHMCPNFPILREGPLLLILRLKLPGNVAHGDHAQHVAHARTRWRHCLLTQALLKHHAPHRKNRQNVPCFNATLSATRPETLCFVSVSPLTRLKTFYLFYERDCRYKTDVRFPENL